MLFKILSIMIASLFDNFQNCNPKKNCVILKVRFHLEWLQNIDVKFKWNQFSFYGMFKSLDEVIRVRYDLKCVSIIWPTVEESAFRLQGWRHKLWLAMLFSLRLLSMIFYWYESRCWVWIYGMIQGSCLVCFSIVYMALYRTELIVLSSSKA